MPLNAVGSIQTSKPQIANAKSDSFAEKVKKTIDVNGNSSIKEEVMVGLGALATIAVAGIMLAKGKGTKATQTVVESAQKPVNTIVQTVTDSKAVETIAQEAADNYVAGGNYAQIKRAATKNHSKADKKIIKGKMAQARSEMLANQKAQKEASKHATNVANEAQSVLNRSSQGMKNATSPIEVDVRVKNAKQAAEVTSQVSEMKADIAQANPTHKNKKTAHYFDTKAQQSSKKASNIEDHGEKVKAKIQEEAENKAKNIEAMKQSSNYEKGVKLQEEHAKQTSQTAINRKAKNMASKPAYQRTINKYDKASKEVVEKAYRKATNEAEKAALEDLLATL